MKSAVKSAGFRSRWAPLHPRPRGHLRLTECRSFHHIIIYAHRVYVLKEVILGKSGMTMSIPSNKDESHQGDQHSEQEVITAKEKLNQDWSACQEQLQRLDTRGFEGEVSRSLHALHDLINHIQVRTEDTRGIALYIEEKLNLILRWIEQEHGDPFNTSVAATTREILKIHTYRFEKDTPPEGFDVKDVEQHLKDVARYVDVYNYAIHAVTLANFLRAIHHAQDNEDHILRRILFYEFDELFPGVNPLKVQERLTVHPQSIDIRKWCDNWIQVNCAASVSEDQFQADFDDEIAPAGFGLLKCESMIFKILRSDNPPALTFEEHSQLQHINSVYSSLPYQVLLENEASRDPKSMRKLEPVEADHTKENVAKANSPPTNTESLQRLANGTTTLLEKSTQASKSPSNFRGSIASGPTQTRTFHHWIYDGRRSRFEVPNGRALSNDLEFRRQRHFPVGVYSSQSHLIPQPKRVYSMTRSLVASRNSRCMSGVNSVLGNLSSSNWFKRLLR